MIHTATLTTAISEKEYNFLLKSTKRNTGKIYTLSQIGITSIKPIKIINDYEYYFCEIIINLNRIANNGKRTNAPFMENSESLKRLYENFSKYISRLLPYRQNINCWTVKRIDYTIDIKTPYCTEYISLLQKGNRPKKLQIDSKDKHKKEIDKRHYSGSVRFTCKSYTINIYDKFKERTDKGTPKEIANESKNILRIEIQCKSSKIAYISKKYGLYGQTIQNLTQLISEQSTMFLRALKAIEGGGYYYKLDTAIKRVKESTKKETIKNELITLLQSINNFRSVVTAGAKYNNKLQFNRLLLHLRELDINPVTIPKRWKVYTLPPLLKLIE